MSAQLLFVSPAPLPKSRQVLIKPTTEFPICRLSSSSSTFEPSYPLSYSKNTISSLLSTTVYHNIPSVPKHHAISDTKPLAHRNDGDGYILAISFPSDAKYETWVRGRFVRTKPFIIESRMRKRIYRGAYGTPGAVGLKAPVKPKASCARGVGVWSSQKKFRIIAFGIRALPLAVNADTLATVGPTALGSVLTESDELVNQRPTELSAAPVSIGSYTITVGVSRSSTGRIVGSFVTELDENWEVVKRYSMIKVPNRCDVYSICVNEEYCVLAMQRTKGESGGILSAVLGTGKEKSSPVVDKDYGTIITLISRKSGHIASCRLSHVLLTQLCGMTTTSRGVILDAVEFSQIERRIIQTSTVADSLSGDLWDSKDLKGDISSKISRTTIEISEMGSKMSATVGNTERKQIENDIMVLDSLQCATRNYICRVFDIEKNQHGIAVYDKTGVTLQQKWLSDEIGNKITGTAISPDGEHLSALSTNGDNKKPQLLIFLIDKISDGPVEKISLDTEKFGNIGRSVGAVWANYASAWTEYGSKSIKSSYEIFNSREWNDIESGFSSLGV